MRVGTGFRAYFNAIVTIRTMVASWRLINVTRFYEMQAIVKAWVKAREKVRGRVKVGVTVRDTVRTPTKKQHTTPIP